MGRSTPPWISVPSKAGVVAARVAAGAGSAVATPSASTPAGINTIAAGAEVGSSRTLVNVNEFTSLAKFERVPRTDDVDVPGEGGAEVGVLMGDKARTEVVAGLMEDEGGKVGGLPWDKGGIKVDDALLEELGAEVGGVPWDKGGTKDVAVPPEEGGTKGREKEIRDKRTSISVFSFYQNIIPYVPFWNRGRSYRSDLQIYCGGHEN